MTKKNKIKFLQFFIIALNIALIYFWLFFKFDNNLKVSFLDIGQGDAILIQTPFNQNILIDGGPTENKLISELNNQMHLWDKTIDLLILTHPDKDHINGTIAAIKR
ncbi:MAG: MBL fold metallo-hydrolase, partial [Candidatus Falkowbacteria bacterium]|nr:MBL fold metallo-hydrolase [Candidatus Falkowbacteria bacterium]